MPLVTILLQYYDFCPATTHTFWMESFHWPLLTIASWPQYSHWPLNTLHISECRGALTPGGPRSSSAPPPGVTGQVTWLVTTPLTARCLAAPAPTSPGPGPRMAPRRSPSGNRELSASMYSIQPGVETPGWEWGMKSRQFNFPYGGWLHTCNLYLSPSAPCLLPRVWSLTSQ